MGEEFTVHMRAFMRAAELAGGAEALADRLRLPRKHVRDWANGSRPVPADAFLKVVDFLIDHDLHEIRKKP